MKEEDIRPKKVFDEYLRLTNIDTKTYFKDKKSKKIKCPACNAIGQFEFNKHGFDYEQCPKCNTLYVSPRPSNKYFNQYYTEAPSVEYWANVFYKVTEDDRRKKLWKPKAKSIKKKIEKYGKVSSRIIDIGGGYGIFAEEMNLLIKDQVTVIEPGPKLAENCKKRGIRVVQKFLENVEKRELPAGSKVFVSFELFEHLHDPKKFLTYLYKLMQRNDLFIFTTLSSLGLDIQTLWEDSKSVSPPHHLNFFNPYSIKLLLNKIGLQDLEISTPGKLDIDILSNNSEKIKDRFWRNFVLQASSRDKKRWQKIISESCWSSHMMVVCKKN